MYTHLILVCKGKQIRWVYPDSDVPTVNVGSRSPISRRYVGSSNSFFCILNDVGYKK